MQWSQVKKRMKEFLAPSVRERVDFHRTVYSHGGVQRGDCAHTRNWITFDGVEIVNVPYEWLRSGQSPALPDKGSLTEALFWYLKTPFEELLAAPNPFMRSVAMLDARLGKRRLRQLDAESMPELVRALYAVRCRAEGLPAPEAPSLDEGSRILRRRIKRAGEADRAARDRERSALARELLAGRRREENPGTLKKLPREEVVTPLGRTLADFPDEALRALRRSALLEDAWHARGVLTLLAWRHAWVRPLEEWSPASSNADRQFASLARHLLAAKPVPAFMDSAWLTGRPVDQELFLHVGATGEIFGAPALPVKLTRRMAGAFMAAPDHYSVGGALRWAQVYALGGDRRVADGLLGTRLESRFEDDEFWKSVLTFFIKNPMLDTANYGPIIDFIIHRRQEQPGFSMRGRSPETLLRQVEEWHAELGRASAAEGPPWKPSGIGRFDVTEGSGKEKRRWIIREILNAGELVEEGRAMSHCVASYASSCREGKCSIWTMWSGERLLTLEVDSARQIRQARGKRNRLPKPQEMDVLRRWAQQENLVLAPWLNR